MSDIFDIVDMTQVDEPVKKGRNEVYPFSKLKIGQGFKMREGANISSMRVLASTRGRTLGMKFKVSVNGYVERIA